MAVESECHVVGDVEVRPAVAVEVREGRANGPIRAGEGCVRRDVPETAVAQVLDELVGPEVGEEHVEVAVVVDVAGGDAHAVAGGADPRFGSGIDEAQAAAARLVAVQPIAGKVFGLRAALDRPALHQPDVLPAIPVEVEEAQARAHDLDEPGLADHAVVMDEVEARFGGHVRERVRVHGRRRRDGEEQGDRDPLFDARSRPSDGLVSGLHHTECNVVRPRYNQPMIRAARHVLLGVFAFAATMANAVTVGLPGATGDAQLGSLRAGLEGREYATVAGEAERLVAEIERASDRYAPALIEPLTFLGDARMGLDEPAAALEAYDRAKHITRITEGVQSLEQLRLLYREAVALDAMGDRSGANERHEFAYSLRRREHGVDSLEMLPAINDLVGWYRHHYKFRPAQILYENALDILREHYEPDDELIIGALRGYVDTFRQRRFGTREPGRGGFSAWPPGENRDPPWYKTRSYIRGKNALAEVLELIEGKPTSTDAEIAAAMLELADWYLLYDESGLAMRYYRSAWNLLKDDQQALEAAFANPTPLYVPRPDRRAKAVEENARSDGIVVLALTITHRGDVVGRKTLRAEPPDIMEFKVRKAAKRAVYRPAFADADPVRWKGLTLEYRYEYLDDLRSSWR